MEKHIHFIGIGGIGMSSLAQILQIKGHKVSGSDLQKSEITQSLKGIDFIEGQRAENINKKMQLIIYSHAIPTTNPEYKAAKKSNARLISYPEALAELSKQYFSIAIAGTHGKSTTTAMLALILVKAKLDPTVVVGTKIREFQNKNYRVGESKFLIMEACEHKESFSKISPQILCITNIEPEHLDYYKTAENYFKAFDFAKKNAEKVITNPEKLDYSPGVPGDFNIDNASLAAAIARELGIDDSTIKTALQDYKGSWRRMEKKETKYKTLKFIDDYGHHPTEVKATLKAVREENPQAKILCVFQPHQYSRTFYFLEEFGESFKDVDKVLIPNIYKVRDTEEDLSRVSPESLVLQINENSNNAQRVQGLEAATKYIDENQDKYDLVITMGAGDITSIYTKLSSK